MIGQGGSVKSVEFRFVLGALILCVVGLFQAETASVAQTTMLEAPDWTAVPGNMR